MVQAPRSVATERNYGIDLLRMVSMLMVVVLHILGQGGILNGAIGHSGNYESAWLLETAAYGAVNCYALISGYVGIRSKYRYTNIVMLWLQVVFYTVGITAVHAMIAPQEVGMESWVLSVIPVFGRSYWYFTDYFALFFFMPLLNFAVRSLSKRQLGVVLISIMGLFTATSFLPGANFKIDPFQVASGYSLIWLAMLYLVGAYVREYGLWQKLCRPALAAIWLGGSALAWAIKMAMEYAPTSVQENFPSYLFVRYNSPLIFLASLALLLLFSRSNSMPRPIKRWIGWMAPLAFGVYLIHTNGYPWGILKDYFAEYANAPILTMLGIVAVAVIGIYAACTVIEVIRFYLFKALRIKQGLLKLEQRLLGNLWK